MGAGATGVCLGVLGGALLALGQGWPPLCRAQQLLIALIQDMAQQSTAGRKVHWETRQTGSRTQGRALAGLPLSPGLLPPRSHRLGSGGGSCLVGPGPVYGQLEEEQGMAWGSRARAHRLLTPCVRPGVSVPGGPSRPLPGPHSTPSLQAPLWAQIRPLGCLCHTHS